MSDEKYAKLVETIRYMNREKLERARARRLRHARGREVRLEGEDPDGEGEGEDDNDDDNDDHAAEECAALLQDDPQLGTRYRNKKKARITHHIVLLCIAIFILSQVTLLPSRGRDPGLPAAARRHLGSASAFSTTTTTTLRRARR